MTKLYPTMASILLESIMLQEGPLNPAEMKTKLGIKADSISDQDMQSLMDITGDKKQLVSLVKYALETKDLQSVKLYAMKMVELDPKLDPQRFLTFIQFSEYLDSKVAKQTGPNFNLDSQKPDWESADHRYRVYKASGKQDCIKYGHGHSFCISRTKGGNLFNHYRSNQESNFYFVFDTKQPEDSETYITVVDAQPDGKYEFTHKSNNTPATTDDYNHSLDQFLASKPGLAAAKAFFQPMPLTDAEKAENKRWHQVAVNPNQFLQLSREDKLAFINFGQYDIHGKNLMGMDAKLQNEYVTIFGSRCYDTDLQYFEPRQQVRILADMLDSDYFAVNEPILKAIVDNISSCVFNLDTKNNTLQQGRVNFNWEQTMEILEKIADPLPVLKTHSSQDWANAMERLFIIPNDRETYEIRSFIAKVANLPAIEAYVNTNIFSDAFKRFTSEQIYTILERQQLSPELLPKFRTEQWASLYKNGALFNYILQDSNLAFSILTLVAAAINSTIKLVFEETASKRIAFRDNVLMNVILTASNPSAVSQEIPFTDGVKFFKSIGISRLVEYMLKCDTDKNLIPFFQLMVRKGFITAAMLDAATAIVPRALAVDFKRASEIFSKLEVANPGTNTNATAQLNEKYLLRFNKILNS